MVTCTPSERAALCRPTTRSFVGGLKRSKWRKQDMRDEAPAAPSSEVGSLYKKQDLSLKQGETIKCASCNFCFHDVVLLSSPPSCEALISIAQEQAAYMLSVMIYATMLSACPACRINMKRPTGEKSGGSMRAASCQVYLGNSARKTVQP